MRWRIPPINNLPTTYTVADGSRAKKARELLISSRRPLDSLCIRAALAGLFLSPGQCHNAGPCPIA